MCDERKRLKAINAELLEALESVMTWIRNWSPDFTDDDTWPADRDKAKAAIARAIGTTPPPVPGGVG
jgi:hypothetical protein